jgi:hypothetical protein
MTQIVMAHFEYLNNATLTLDLKDTSHFRWCYTRRHVNAPGKRFAEQL